jgi:hypothetical protein
MNGKTKVALSGVIAAVLAISLVGAYLYTQNISLGTNSSTTQATTGPTGTLAVLMTDPPTIPEGVTAVYMDYSNLAIHMSDAGNNTGWTNLGSSGDINLLSVVNSTQTIAVANISSGLFNAMKFNVSSAIVTFNGQNYTANLVYQKAYLLVTIPGGIHITNGSTAGAVIDMTPTILLLGNTTNPVFAFLPVAKGYTLPANSVSIHSHVGDHNDDKGSIASQIHDMTHFQLGTVILTPSSLSITVQNTGAATVDFRYVTLTSTETVSGGWVPANPFGPVSKISEFFVVVPNGSLVPVTSSTNRGMIQSLAMAGYTLAPHESATFTYSGPVTIGALTLLQGHTPTRGINVGQNYVVTITGSGLYAQSAVTASSSPTPATTSTSSSASTTLTTSSSSTSISTTSTSTTTSDATTMSVSTSTSGGD